nr:hypothetical protein Iba_chr08cCG9060 [Ipomoea batatas]
MMGTPTSRGGRYCSLLTNAFLEVMNPEPRDREDDFGFCWSVEVPNSGSYTLLNISLRRRNLKLNHSNFNQVWLIDSNPVLHSIPKTLKTDFRKVDKVLLHLITQPTAIPVLKIMHQINVFQITKLYKFLDNRKHARMVHNNPTLKQGNHKFNGRQASIFLIQAEHYILEYLFNSIFLLFELALLIRRGTTITQVGELTGQAAPTFPRPLPGLFAIGIKTSVRRLHRDEKIQIHSTYQPPIAAAQIVQIQFHLSTSQLLDTNACAGGNNIDFIVLFLLLLLIVKDEPAAAYFIHRRELLAIIVILRFILDFLRRAVVYFYGSAPGTTFEGYKQRINEHSARNLHGSAP